MSFSVLLNDHSSKRGDQGEPNLNSHIRIVVFEVVFTSEDMGSKELSQMNESNLCQQQLLGLDRVHINVDLFGAVNRSNCTSGVIAHSFGDLSCIGQRHEGQGRGILTGADPQFIFDELMPPYGCGKQFIYTTVTVANLISVCYEKIYINKMIMNGNIVTVFNLYGTSVINNDSRHNIDDDFLSQQVMILRDLGRIKNRNGIAISSKLALVIITPEPTEDYGRDWYGSNRSHCEIIIKHKRDYQIKKDMENLFKTSCFTASYGSGGDKKYQIETSGTFFDPTFNVCLKLKQTADVSFLFYHNDGTIVYPTGIGCPAQSTILKVRMQETHHTLVQGARSFHRLIDYRYVKTPAGTSFKVKGVILSQRKDSTLVHKTHCDFLALRFGGSANQGVITEILNPNQILIPLVWDETTHDYLIYLASVVPNVMSWYLFTNDQSLFPRHVQNVFRSEMQHHNNVSAHMLGGVCYVKQYLRSIGFKPSMVLCCPSEFFMVRWVYVWFIRVLFMCDHSQCYTPFLLSDEYEEYLRFIGEPSLLMVMLRKAFVGILRVNMAGEGKQEFTSEEVLAYSFSNFRKHLLIKDFSLNNLSIKLITRREGVTLLTAPIRISRRHNHILFESFEVFLSPERKKSNLGNFVENDYLVPIIVECNSAIKLLCTPFSQVLNEWKYWVSKVPSDVCVPRFETVTWRVSDKVRLFSQSVNVFDSSLENSSDEEDE